MPSLNRPNAPDRLPSEDFGDLFFKPRAPRSSEAKSAVSTPSPLSSPANFLTHRRALHSSEGGTSGNAYTPSPLSSPAVNTAQRRPKLAERSLYWSESNNRSGLSRGPLSQSPITSEAIIEESTRSKHTTTSTSTAVSDQPKKTSGPFDLDNPSLIASDKSAPRDARAGFRWTHDFLRGWLEVRVGRQRELHEERPAEELRPETEKLSLPASRTSSVHLPTSHTTTTRGSVVNADNLLLPDTPDPLNSASTPRPLREGLYCRTKRVLGLKHGPISETPHIEPRSRTPTGAVLERVASTLRFLPTRNFSTTTSAATSVSNFSIAAPRKWSRRSGHRDEWSTSSSVRNLRMGKPPTGTPEPEATYMDSDSNKYVSVNLLHPDAPAFLPSEARRINTPPLPSEEFGKGHARGFFFDYTSPPDEANETLPRRPLPSPRQDEKAGWLKEGDWYRVKMDTIENGTVISHEELEANITEHLPNSPLCPRNSRHRSGRKGTCPYHGRNKSTPSDVDGTPTLSRREILSPGSEKWWLR